jgi:hypothetical protein
MRLWLALLALPLWAVPTIREMHPHGAQRGKTVTIYLRGDGLTVGSRIETTLPGTVSRLTPSADEPGKLPFLVHLNADAPVGLYPLRLISNDGISNLMLFSVGTLAETEEAEIRNPLQLNNTPATAEKIAIPALVNGTLTMADEDYYRFTATAGQKLVFEVEGRRVGSGIDPAIEVYDSAGKLLGKNDDAIDVDPRLELTMPRSGEYHVRVHDSRYGESPQNFYRLKIGTYAFADGLFPLGAKKGSELKVEVAGGNLAAPLTMPASTLVRLANSASLPMRFVWSEKSEVLEGSSDTLQAGVIMNGRIAHPKEVDRYKLSVTPGEQWMFEIQAASTGSSQLDALLTVYDSKGKKLASKDDIEGADPALPFTVPAGITEVTIAVEDLLRRGGPAYAYRLEARREPADFVAWLTTPYVNVPAGGTVPINVMIQRRGYEGPIRAYIPNLPEGFSMAGGHISSEATAQAFNEENIGFRQARAMITLTAAPDAKPLQTELTIICEADTPDGIIRRVAQGPGLITPGAKIKAGAFLAPWLGMQLPIALSKPLPVSLRAGSLFARFAQGFEYPLQYKIATRPGGRAPGKVNFQVVDRVGNLRILNGDKAADSGSFLISSNFAFPITTFDVILQTEADIDGKPTIIYAPAVSVEVVQGYRVDLASSKAQVVPGRKVELTGSIWREFTFEGSAIKLQAQELPDNVTCPEIEVPAGETQFKLACEASAKALPGEYEIRIASVAPDTGRKAKADYKAADITAKMTIVSTTAVSGGR